VSFVVFEDEDENEDEEELKSVLIRVNPWLKTYAPFAAKGRLC
jgi:hypothetical protein